jgi:2,3-bisphosphoglycerate-independent phosphoglycerate mutase
MVWASGKFRAVCHPPHEVAGKPIGDFLPAGDGADVLRQAMESAFVILRDHPVNEERRKEGLKPANGLWLWGQGKAVKMAKLTEPRGLTGAVVAGSDLARGVGMAAGLEPVELSSPTMTDGLDLGAYRDAALRELRKHDIVYVQVGLTDPEHADTGAKVALTSDFDRLLVSPLIETLATLGPHRVVVLCDYGMRLKPIELPVPYILFEGPVKSAAPSRPFHEASAAAAGKPRDAAKLMPRLLTKG